MMNMKLQVGVKIALINPEGKILLLKRSDKYGWDLVGGRMNPGKNLSENLKREIKEETGLVWNGVSKLVSAQDIIMPDQHVVRLTFIGHIKGVTKIKKNEESLEFKWFTISELKKLINKGLDRFVAELITNKVIQPELK